MRYFDKIRRLRGIAKYFRRFPPVTTLVRLYGDWPEDVQALVRRKWPAARDDEPVIVRSTPDGHWAAIGLTMVAWGTSSDTTTSVDYDQIQSVTLKCAEKPDFTAAEKLSEKFLVIRTVAAKEYEIEAGPDGMGAFWTMLERALSLYGASPSEDPRA